MGSGFVVMYGFLTAKQLSQWTAFFLNSTILTRVSGFGFPAAHFLPSHLVGILSLAVLRIAVITRYGLQMRGAWRRIYVISASVALYFNPFVLVVQSFEKIPGTPRAGPHRKRAAIRDCAVACFRDYLAP